MNNILIIEDDQDINDMLNALLTSHHYHVTSAFNGHDGTTLFEKNNYDLVLLDYMLPGKSGHEVLDFIRKHSQTPVITVSALDNKGIVIDMLKRGANDYVTKPFDNDELLARIEVQLRPLKQDDLIHQYAIKNLVLKPSLFDATVFDHMLHLSKREFEILQLLMCNPKKVYTKNNLYQSVWQDEFMGDDNTINVHISNIRRKIAQFDPDTHYIKTVWGIGFKIHDEN